MARHTHTGNRTRRNGRRAGSAALVAAALLTVGPAGAANAQQDLRSPDARDAGAASVARSYQDLRSPDSREVSSVPSTPTPAPAPTTADTGTDWTDVGIIAGGVLLVVGLGAGMLFGRRKSLARKARTAVASG
jgi:hypothetical protein